MKIAYFGNNERGCVCLEALVEGGYDVQFVVALPSAEQPKWSRDIIEVARKLGIEKVYVPQDPNMLLGLNSLENFFDVFGIELAILAGYPKLIRKPLLDACTFINLHAGPLPYYRGPAPLNWQIINGEIEIGISIIKVDEGVDTGPILDQEFFSIDVDNDYNDVLEHTLRLYPEMLLRLMKRLEKGEYMCRKQKRTEGFFCTKRYPRDGVIDWKTMSDKAVHNLVRALVKPMPGAFTIRGGQKYFIEKTHLIETTYLGVPGRVAAVWPSGIVIMCANRGLLIEMCRQGDEIVPAKDELFRSNLGRGDFW